MGGGLRGGVGVLHVPALIPVGRQRRVQVAATAAIPAPEDPTGLVREPAPFNAGAEGGALRVHEVLALLKT